MLITHSPICPEVKEHNLAFIAVQVFMSSLFIALCAQISIPLPFTPVPITLQTLSVILVGGMLGSRNGTLSVLLYLAESMLGLPVLAGGAVNPLAVIGPTGGYLIGFVFEAFLAGWFAEKLPRIGRSAFMLGILAAYILQLSVGALWLGQYVGFQHVFMMGIIPFIPGGILQILAAVNFLTRNGKR